MSKETKWFIGKIAVAVLVSCAVGLTLVLITKMAQTTADSEIADDPKLEQHTANGYVLEVFVDPETGVNYVYHASGATGGMSVRYNADGSIYTSQN